MYELRGQEKAGASYLSKVEVLFLRQYAGGPGNPVNSNFVWRNNKDENICLL